MGKILEIQKESKNKQKQDSGALWSNGDGICFITSWCQQTEDIESPWRQEFIKLYVLFV